jgi:putative transposase
MLPKYEYRRKLPHYQPDAKIFFITFCTSRRWVLPAVARTITLETCLRSHRRECGLEAVVIMPDHVHLLLTPLLKDGRTISIPEITQTLKSVSAHRINKALGRKGCVWQEESFDRALRREEAADARFFTCSKTPSVRDSSIIQWTTVGSGAIRMDLNASVCPARARAPVPPPTNT